MLWELDLGLIEHLREHLRRESIPWNPLTEAKAVCVFFLHIGDSLYVRNLKITSVDLGAHRRSVVETALKKHHKILINLWDIVIGFP